MLSKACVRREFIILLLGLKLTVGVVYSCSFARQVVVFQANSEAPLSPVRSITPCLPSRPSLGESYIVIIRDSIFDLYNFFFFSLFGTITRNASLLSTYSLYLGRTLAVQVIIDIIQLVLFFSHSRQNLIQNCIDGSTDQDVKNICDNSFDASKWSLVASMIIGLLIQFCEFSFLPAIVVKRALIISNDKLSFVCF